MITCVFKRIARFVSQFENQTIFMSRTRNVRTSLKSITLSIFLVSKQHTKNLYICVDKIENLRFQMTDFQIGAKCKFNWKANEMRCMFTNSEMLKYMQYHA